MRLWSYGAGLNTTTVGMEWGTTTTGAPAIDTGIYRSNGKALRIVNAAAAEYFAHVFRSAQGVCFIRVYFHVVTSPNTDGRAFVLISNGANLKIGVRMRNAANGRKLQLWNEEDNTQIGSDSSNLNTGQFYRVEIKIDSTTLASTSVEANAYEDVTGGASFWNPSGSSNLTANPDRFIGGFFATDTTGDIVYDDIAINDDSGSYQNSWPGEGRCTYLRPDGNDGTPQWARGGTDSGARISRDPDAPSGPGRQGRALDRREVPEDITGTVLFLCSSDSDFITGQMIVVSGGDYLH